MPRTQAISLALDSSAPHSEAGGQHPGVEVLYECFHRILSLSLPGRTSGTQTSCAFKSLGDSKNTCVQAIPPPMPIKSESLMVGLGLDDFLKLPR